MAFSNNNNEFITSDIFHSIVEKKFNVINKRVDDLENHLTYMGNALKNLLKNAENGLNSKKFESEINANSNVKPVVLEENGAKTSAKKQPDNEIQFEDFVQLTLSDANNTSVGASKPDSVRISKSPEKKKPVPKKKTPVKMPVVSRKRPRSKHTKKLVSHEMKSDEVKATVDNSDLSSSFSSPSSAGAKSLNTPKPKKSRRIKSLDSDSDLDVPLSTFLKPKNQKLTKRKSSLKAVSTNDWAAMLKSIRPCVVKLDKLSADAVSK